MFNLDGFLNWRFIAFRSFNGFSGSGIRGGGFTGSFSVKIHQFIQIESRFLQDLDFSNVNVVKGIDSLTSLENIGRHGIGDQFLNDILQVTRSNFSGHDVNHLLTDLTDLLGLGVASLLGLLTLLLGKSNAESPDQISVSGFDIGESFDQSLPFFNHGSEFIGGQTHTVKVG